MKVYKSLTTIMDTTIARVILGIVFIGLITVAFIGSDDYPDVKARVITIATYGECE